MYKKLTLRRMQTITRRYARTINTLDGTLRKLKNLTQDIARLEADSRALLAQKNYNEQRRHSDEAQLHNTIDAYFNEAEQPTHQDADDG